MMNSGCSVGDIIAISGLAIRVHTAYKVAGDDYRQIVEEVAKLQTLIGQVAQHFKSTTISSDSHRYGQNVLKGCQSVLQDLNLLMEKYKRLASTNRRPVFKLTGIKLGTEDIVSLRERLISNTILLKGFVRRFVVPGIYSINHPIDINIFHFSCAYIEIQKQLATILGLHHTNSEISVTSIASFAANTDTQAAYTQFCKDLYQIGVKEGTILQKENEILDVFKSQGMVSNDIRDQGQLLGASCTYVRPLIYQNR